jgi:REP element-mobilizing transposase RayT
MPRPLRPQIPGGVYHITSRGNKRAWIYHQDTDRRLWIDLLANAVERYGLVCLSFCVMSTHFHLLVQTPQPNVSRAMQWLNGRFAQISNMKYGATGHVLEGRFKAKLVEDDAHLLEVVRYIARNPVRADICSRPELWPWSSYAATIGLRRCPPYVAADRVLALFTGGPRLAREQLRAFVDAGRDEEPIPAALAA